MPKTDAKTKTGFPWMIIIAMLVAAYVVVGTVLGAATSTPPTPQPAVTGNCYHDISECNPSYSAPDNGDQYPYAR